MDQEEVDDGKAPMCMGLGGNQCPADVLGALGVQVEGGDRAKAEPMEPKKGEKSWWRGGRCSLAVRVLTGSSQGGQVQGPWAWRGA